MRLHAGFCAVGACDVVATTSARTPRPVLLRVSGMSGLHLKAGRNARSTTVLALASPPSLRRALAAPVAAATREADLSHAASSNGSHPSPPVHPNPAMAAIHGGERQGRPEVHDALTTPIVQSSTYWFKDTQQVIDFQEGRLASHEYGRYGNPTTRAAEKKIMALEGAEDALVSASGMSSVTSMLMSLVPAGGHVITTRDCYWRTRQFMINFLPKMNIRVSIVEFGDLATLQTLLDEASPPVSLFFSETPTNPYLRCIDVPTISKMCHAAGAVVCIDSTFATPMNQQALSLGADLVLHSATKYLAGHNDVLAGAIAGKPELITQIKLMHNILGGVTDPHAAYLLLRGMKTLELRVARHNASAMELARRLEEHPKIDRVWYPGLESHPDHAIAKAQMSGFGGVVSFEVKGDLAATARFQDAVQIPYIAPSLGGVESLIEMPAVQSYWSFGPEGRAAIGIKENLIRYSTGIENVEDIWADFKQALEKV